MINKNSEAEKGFRKQRRNSPSKEMVIKCLERSKATHKFDHDITFNKAGCFFLNVPHFFIFIKRKFCNLVSSPQNDTIPLRRKRGPASNLYQHWFFLVFSSPQNFRKLSRTWRRKKAERKRRLLSLKGCEGSPRPENWISGLVNKTDLYINEKYIFSASR